MNIICFHNPDDENAYLSNWYRSDFSYAGIHYSSLEQYMMHQKALYFGDLTTAEKILATDDCAQIKALGREVQPFDRQSWNGVRQIIVYEGLLAKFSQNEDLRQQLLATGEALLVECSATDKIWANGLAMNDPRRLDPEQWQGQNLLGYALMRVREKLREM